MARYAHMPPHLAPGVAFHASHNISTKPVDLQQQVDAYTMH